MSRMTRDEFVEKIKLVEKGYAGAGTLLAEYDRLVAENERLRKANRVMWDTLTVIREHAATIMGELIASNKQRTATTPETAREDDEPRD